MTGQMTLGQLLQQRLKDYDLDNASRTLPIDRKALDGLAQGKFSVLGSIGLWNEMLHYVDIDPATVALSTTTRVTVRRPKFKDRLKLVRERNFMTQEAVAKSANIAYGTYTQYESGRRTPPFPAVVKIAQALKVDVNFFAECDFDEQESPPSLFDAPAPEPEHDDDDGKDDPIPF